MIRVNNLVLPLGEDIDFLRRVCCKKLKLSEEQIKGFFLSKKAVDARRKEDVHFVCSVDILLHSDEWHREWDRLPHVLQTVPYEYTLEKALSPGGLPPVVVGFGPAGLFAALILAQAGLRPVVVERGGSVEQRQQSIRRFWETGELNPECNVQFGEGGAGTFSDGKLTTGTKDSRRYKVLEELCRAGAPEEIRYLSKPHIGTDLLAMVVKNIRQTIVELGGEVYFNTRLEQLHTTGGRLRGITLRHADGGHRELSADRLILAVGHSARDTMEMLLSTGLELQQKAFSVGVRIEHLQSSVNTAQYGRFAGHPALGAADYKLSERLPGGRGVYTFCMCPGGQVVAAASQPGMVATNGMSEYARDGVNANSALLVGVTPEDFDGSHPLAGIAFQQKIEGRAFEEGGGNYRAPAQLLGDFLKDIPSTQLGKVTPTYQPGVTLTSFYRVLPPFVCKALGEAVTRMDQKLKGFASPDAVMTAPETRSSSPVRILRDPHTLQTGILGLYPCGEGAGYAGGILSAAVDGIRCAEQILKGKR